MLGCPHRRRCFSKQQQPVAAAPPANLVDQTIIASAAMRGAFALGRILIEAQMSVFEDRL
jgi:hypothetical protein